jgi:hypothetical protein
VAFLIPLLLEFDEARQLAAVEYASQATIPAATDEGSSFGSVFDAFSLLTIEQQQQQIYNAAIARLYTIPPNADGTPNPDVDSFVQPFGFKRITPIASTGVVQFVASSPVSNPNGLLVPFGAIVTTSSVAGAPAGLQFTVIAGTGDNPALGGYVIPYGQTTVNANVQCSTGGTIGNVQAGQIANLYGGPGAVSVTGISSVSNAAAFTNGSPYETDAQLMVRFTLGESTGPVATVNALAAAVLSVQAGLTYAIGDGLNAAGAATAATVTIPVNVIGQSSAPSGALIALVQAALNLARSAGVTVTAIAPTINAVPASVTAHVATGANTTAIAAALTTAFDTYVNAIGLNPAGNPVTLSYFAVAVILQAVAGVNRIDSLLINGATADITAATFATQIVAGTLTISFVEP